MVNWQINDNKMGTDLINRQNIKCFLEKEKMPNKKGISKIEQNKNEKMVKK